MAVSLFGKIKKKTGLDLPLATLFRNPTLKELTESLDPTNNYNGTDTSLLKSVWHKISNPAVPLLIGSKHKSQAPWNAMVPIKTEGTLPPVFFLHAIGGNVINYSALLPYLDERQPVYGLQAKGLDGLSEPYKNLYQMIKDYANEIQKVNAYGPYLLAGGSMGGLLALEVARFLQSNGKKVKFLGMFDTMGPNGLAKAEGLPNDHQGDYLPDPGMLSRITDHWPNIRIISIFSHLVNLSMYYVFKAIRRPRPEDLRQWMMVYSHLKIFRSYRPELYNGKITLFRSSYSNTEDTFYGWQEIADSIDNIYIPAHHGNFVESPELGKELNSYLKRLNNDFKQLPTN